eukprot:29517-Pelagococcus_subviridis.AAC.1
MAPAWQSSVETKAPGSSNEACQRSSRSSLGYAIHGPRDEKCPTPCQHSAAQYLIQRAVSPGSTSRCCATSSVATRLSPWHGHVWRISGQIYDASRLDRLADRVAHAERAKPRSRLFQRGGRALPSRAIRLRAAQIAFLAASHAVFPDKHQPD